MTLVMKMNTAEANEKTLNDRNSASGLNGPAPELVLCLRPLFCSRRSFFRFRCFLRAAAAPLSSSSESSESVSVLSESWSLLFFLFFELASLSESESSDVGVGLALALVVGCRGGTLASSSESSSDDELLFFCEVISMVGAGLGLGWFVCQDFRKNFGLNKSGFNLRNSRFSPDAY